MSEFLPVSIVLFSTGSTSHHNLNIDVRGRMRILLTIFSSMRLWWQE